MLSQFYCICRDDVSLGGWTLGISDIFSLFDIYINAIIIWLQLHYHWVNEFFSLNIITMVIWALYLISCSVKLGRLYNTIIYLSSFLITESRNTTNSSSWDYPCHNHHVVPSSFERTVDHILQPGEYESCDNEYWYHYGYYGYSNGEISSDNWYRFENYENVLNRPPEQLSCGSLYPIWFDGN